MTNKDDTAKVQYVSAKKNVISGGKGIVLPKFDYVVVQKSHINRYRNCLFVLMGISGCPRNLIDYLIEHMSDNNIVGNNSMTRGGFLAACNKAGVPEYSDSTIKDAFKQLVVVNFLIPLQKGFYAVNPQYFFSGAENDRNKMIKLTLEFSAGTTTALTILKRDK